MSTRRDFVRLAALGAGGIFIPKAFDRFRWKARPSGIVTVGYSQVVPSLTPVGAITTTYTGSSNTSLVFYDIATGLLWQKNLATDRWTIMPTVSESPR